MSLDSKIVDKNDYVPVGNLGAPGVKKVMDLNTGEHLVEKAVPKGGNQEHIIREATAIEAVHEAYRTLKGIDDPSVYAPGVIRVVGITADQKRIYLPFIDRESLDSKKKRSAYEIGTILVDALDGLGLVHLANLRHADIKPANILDTSGSHPTAATLIDFGIAHSRESEPDWNSVELSPAYASPQQLNCVRDPRVDTWGVGCVAYELLTGGLPYEFPSFPLTNDSYLDWSLARIRLMEKGHLSFALKPEIERETPEGLVHVVTKALAFKSNERPSLLELRNSIAREFDIPETKGYKG